MDVPDTRVGNTVYLPVRVEGSHFFTEDCHVAQGQGELCGVALEVTARVTVTFEVVKNREIAWPRIESEEHIMTVGSFFFNDAATPEIYTLSLHDALPI